MTTKIADDFAEIARRLREIEAPAPDQSLGKWWCDHCQEEVTFGNIVGDERGHESHSCGHPVEPYCDTCENGGWVQIYSPMPPAFGVCQSCFNPWGHKSP